jgi:hypothetical protein
MGGIMRKIAFVLLLAPLTLAGVQAQTPPQGEVAKRIIGAWKLVGTSTDGKVNPERGGTPTGIIFYHASGHMAVQIQPDRQRPKWSGRRPTPDEARETLFGYTAYFGSYEIDEVARTVRHIRTGGIQPGPLPDFIRRFEFTPEGRLVLRPVESKNELVWERIK